MSSSGKQPQSSRIGDIVQQVKSGQKEKSAAFAELQGILRSSAHGESNDYDDDRQDSSQVPETSEHFDGGDGDQDYDAGSTSTTGMAVSRISQEDRRLLINKLIEKKRQNRMSAQKAEATEEEQYDLQDSQYAADWQEGQQIFRGGRGGEASYAFTRASMDDSYIVQGGDARSNRIAQTEAAIRQEMFKECRFRPQIKDLPSFYGGMKEKEADFYGRVTKWQREKESEATRRKKAMDSSDLIGCTWKPKINRNSEKAVKEIRGDIIEPATERLYKSSEIAINQRSKFIEDELERERQEEATHCTFHPKLTHSKRFSQVKSKFTKIEKKKDIPPEEMPDAKKCTFTPKVKGVRPSMTSAQLYCSADVVERLTRPIVSGPPDDSMTAFDAAYGSDRPAMDVASFMGALDGKNKSRPSSAPPRAGQTIELSEEESKARKEQFEQFMTRQNQQKIRKDKHIEQKTKVLTPSYQPKLCRKSIELATAHQKGEFLERLERDVLRRVKDETKKITDADPECTFNPEISKKGKELRPRSGFELSRGDLLRKENNKRMMKLRCDQELMTELTFKPHITKKAQKQSVDSKITKMSIITDPGQYLQAQEEKRKKREEVVSAELKKRETDEMESCTFAPKTKECPAYVKRIAKSMAIMRAARTGAQEEDPDKPTWK